jgi:hypothetical protein
MCSAACVSNSIVDVASQATPTDSDTMDGSDLDDIEVIAMRKLLKGRLNFHEVLYAVCERKVGKPLVCSVTCCTRALARLLLTQSRRQTARWQLLVPQGTYQAWHPDAIDQASRY